MTKIVAATAFIAVFFCISPANAQMLSVQNSTTTTENKQQDWSFYTDAANRMLYIDFEKINVNLAAVSVKTLDGKLVFKDDSLWQLPVNTIYEVDFSKQPKGDFVVELRTFTTTIRRTVTIQ